MARLSVVICTYERPVLLEKALRSILALDGLEGAGLDVVVVDNSDSGSARGVVEKVVAGGRKINLQIRPLTPGRYRFFDDYHEDTTEGFLVVK